MKRHFECWKIGHSIGLWGWCITITSILDIIHRPGLIKTRRFGDWILFPSSGEAQPEVSCLIQIRTMNNVQNACCSSSWRGIRQAGVFSSCSICLWCPRVYTYLFRECPCRWRWTPLRCTASAVLIVHQVILDLVLWGVSTKCDSGGLAGCLWSSCCCSAYVEY
jgi:hypothetical protein